MATRENSCSYGDRAESRAEKVEPIKRETRLLLVFLLLAIALRLLRLGFQPLWWDEGYSVWFATQPLAQMLALTAQDIHPPLYYALLHGWTLLLGTSPAVLRLLSVVVGTLTIPFIYLAARRMLARRAALLATLLLTINPLHVYYSQEVRMYGLVALLGTGILAAAWRVFEQGSRGPEERSAGVWGVWGWFRLPSSVTPTPPYPHTPPHRRTSARLHPPRHRRALHPVLRGLPANRLDALRDLALATKPSRRCRRGWVLRWSSRCSTCRGCSMPGRSWCSTSAKRWWRTRTGRLARSLTSDAICPPSLWDTGRPARGLVAGRVGAARAAAVGWILSHEDEYGRSVHGSDGVWE